MARSCSIGKVNSISIPFHASDFEDQEYREYVFFCLWEDGLKSSERPRIEEKATRLDRLRSVLLGQRNLSQQTLEIVISGYDSPNEAEAAFRPEVGKLIQPNSSSLVADASDQ